MTTVLVVTLLLGIVVILNRILQIMNLSNVVKRAKLK